MNLILRLLYVVFSGLRGRRIQPLDESVLTFRVFPNDLDTNLHMNNGRYLTLMDLGRVDLLLRLGLAGEVRRRRWNPVVASLAIRYRRSLAPWQKYELRTRVVGWDERWFFMEQSFTRGGELMAHAIVKALFVGPEGRVRPQDLVDASGFSAASPEIPESVRRWEEAEDAILEQRELVHQGG